MKFFTTYFCCAPDWKAEWKNNGVEFWAELHRDCGAFGQKWVKHDPITDRWFWDYAETNSNDLLRDLPHDFAIQVFGACKKCKSPSRRKICSSCLEGLPVVDWENAFLANRWERVDNDVIAPDGEVFWRILEEEGID